MLLEYINNFKSEPMLKWLENNRSGLSTAAFGVTGAAKYFLAAITGKRFLYVAKDRLAAKAAANEIGYLTGKKVVYLPAKDDVLLYKKFFDKQNYYERITALCGMADAYAVVTTTEALMQTIPDRLPVLTLKKEGEYPLETVGEKLVRAGYTRSEFAYEKGSFALRGDILEIFPINSDTAYRFDFFGDEIERIRVIGEDGKAGADEDCVDVCPAIDFSIKKSDVLGIESTIAKCLKRFKTIVKLSKARKIANEITSLLEAENFYDPSLSFVAPLLKGSWASVFDHFPAEAIYFDEPKMIYDYTNGVLSEHSSRFASLLEAGEVFDFSFDNLRGEDYLYSQFSLLPCYSFQTINSVVKFFTPLSTLRFNVTAPSHYQGKTDELARDLIFWKKSGYRAIVACGSVDRRKKAAEGLLSFGVNAIESDEPKEYEDVFATSYYLTNGFVLHDERVAVLGTCDLFITGVKEKKIKRKRNDTFVAPEVGDFAVHEDYGIGLIRGTKKISTTDSVKDYVAIEYAEGDILYIPVEYMDKLSKYMGGDESPQLNRLGNGEFEKIKERVRRSISQMSINLKKLYNDRKNSVGFAFSPDGELSREFGDAFPYPLTEDQAQSLEEIKADMESKKIMDRLLLGDVGFGKTEVALRAAFKAVLDFKQVAIVAPTTVLCEQHYHTVLSRFKGFGVRVGVLDRFQKPSAVANTVAAIEKGDIDIVVGTHRLFGKDVKFKDLGLLILDEEQRFGVEHKEKLRDIKRDVDTLTMSATPIPRTLHMSLTGIRDISMIMTPPSKRLPVQSYVVEESDALIRDAIVKELSRQGQVFILYNEVKSIYAFHERMSSLVPEAKMAVGHGQMTRDELENHIMAFYRGEYDVLIATTIIENGIDIPRANTLIVIDADKLGLFSLYQLKGRVGRSDKMAHAYFTYKAEKVLSDQAYKRLSALMENSELGSGYKIAMRDLEIRGAGNVLGREQHGHMDKIGYELYSKLLKEQLGEVTKDFETELDVKLDAYIPESYIASSASRLDLYKSLADIRSDEDAARVVASAKENYGELPEEVSNLLLIAQIKNLCKKHEIIKLSLNKKGCTMIFKDLNSLSGGGILQAAEAFKARASMAFSTNPSVIVSGTEAKETAVFVKRFLIFALEENKS